MLACFEGIAWLSGYGGLATGTFLSFCQWTWPALSVPWYVLLVRTNANTESHEFMLLKSTIYHSCKRDTGVCCIPSS
jgi:hypothetical protein